MIETPAAKTATVLAIGSLFTAAPFGIAVQDIAVGMGFAVVGVLGRGMVDMQKVLEKGGTVKISTTIGWMGAGMIGSPFITIVYLAVLKGIHYPVDAFTALVLLALGYAGPKGVTDLMSYATRLIPGRVNPAAPPTNNGG